MNSNFSKNTVLVQFGNQMSMFVFNRDSGSLRGIVPNGNMIAVSIGPIQNS